MAEIKRTVLIEAETESGRKLVVKDGSVTFHARDGSEIAFSLVDLQLMTQMADQWIAATDSPWIEWGDQGPPKA